MNLFINHFAFTEPRDDIIEQNVIEALSSLGRLFIALRQMNIELSIHQSLSQTSFLEKSIRDYIKQITDFNTKRSVIHLIGKIKPICSDIDTAYEDDENIVLGNCKEEQGSLDILNTFMSCAIYYNNPILTINNLCAKEQFLEDTLNIVCDDRSYQLNNYQLVPYEDLLVKLEEYQKNKKLDEYNQIVNWDDYRNFVNEYFLHSKITRHCITELSKRYAYNNSYAVDFRSKVKRIDIFIERQGGNPKSVDFNKLSQKHYSPESDTRYKALKKSHSGILNYVGTPVDLNWHTWVQDCRMYFEKEDGYICFVHYEKKIV